MLQAVLPLCPNKPSAFITLDPLALGPSGPHTSGSKLHIYDKDIIIMVCKLNCREWGTSFFFWAFINFELWAMFIVNLYVYCMSIHIGLRWRLFIVNVRVISVWAVDPRVTRTYLLYIWLWKPQIYIFCHESFFKWYEISIVVLVYSSVKIH